VAAQRARDPQLPAVRARLGPAVDVELAVTGLSNRDIAQSLFVSEKTVEAHLGRAYRKLGIRSRGRLAAALGGRPS
jgi:DNA-binding NarL/FixJ family response regulator